MESLKRIKDIFKDYEIDAQIKDAIIENIDLFKKQNKLQVNIIFDQKVNLKELESFEKYLKDRFKIDLICITIKYKNEIEYDMEEEWNGIIKYIAKKYPFTKKILDNSQITIEQKNIKVILAVKGEDFLYGRKFDVTLKELFQNIYDKEYKVGFVENIQEENLKAYEELAKQAQDKAIQEARQGVGNEDSIDPSRQGYSPLQTQTFGANQNPEEDSPVILGRGVIKSALIKIAELSMDSGKVAIEGDVLNIDSRELKNGKYLVLFDVYDGTSTITCKCFVETRKVSEILNKVKNAKGVKLAGTAQFDPYAKEIGIIANQIVKTEGISKKEREDFAETKRVELHMHTQMSQMDGITHVKDLIKRAMNWGMKSIAITDHGVVQSFPDAHKLLRKR